MPCHSSCYVWNYISVTNTSKTIWSSIFKNRLIPSFGRSMYVNLVRNLPRAFICCRNVAALHSSGQSWRNEKFLDFNAFKVQLFLPEKLPKHFKWPSYQKVLQQVVAVVQHLYIYRSWRFCIYPKASSFYNPVCCKTRVRIWTSMVNILRRLFSQQNSSAIR